MGQKFAHLLKVNNIKKGITLGLIVAITGLLLASSPIGEWLEEEIGLSWLFKVRGPLPAPEEIVVVGIDQESSSKLGLTNKPRKWPRLLHAHLVNRLSKLGARAVGFDIIFDEPRDPEHNRLFAEQMKKANNVILFQYLRQENIVIASQDGKPSGEARIEKLVLPVSVLKENALGLAPFPLPKVPARVNHFLLYKPSLGDAPTMPVVLLQTYALPYYNDFYTLLQKHIPEQLTALPSSREQLEAQGNIHLVTKHLRRLFHDNPQLGRQLQHELRQKNNKLLETLVRVYESPYSHFLNFYGPARSIRTVPYHEVLFNKQLDLKNKVVVVGFSEQFQPEQKDGFYTVFSEETSGRDISGVEIIATAFANLLTDQTIKATPLWFNILLLVAWGILLGIGLRILPGSLQIPAAIILALIYSVSVYFIFSHYNSWLPFSVPVLWQVPLATLATLFWRYLDVQKERRNIREAFGYHLPVEVVDQLADGVDHITDAGQQVHGIVLATDAQQYTTLSEQLPPDELRNLMNRYYETLFTPIRKHSGIVSDVVGDAAMAIWASAQNDHARRHEACLAALEILAAVNDFNASSPQNSLPTRIGLHYGEIVMGHVGAVDHYEYRAVGDIVNTASRIEGLNKHLGTRILVSEDVIGQLEGFAVRNLGEFILAGKHRPLTIYELTGMQENTSQPDTTLFDEALKLFQAGQWQQSHECFTQYLHDNNNDGPARFFQQRCSEYLQNPPGDWDGIMRMSTK